MSEATQNPIRPVFRFMLEHAGYCTPPGRAACALELARNERTLEEAVALDVAEVRWVDDFEPYDAGDVDTPEQVARYFESGRWTGPYGCTLSVAGEEVASLWGIVVGPKGTDDPYCRVVQAELASEVLDDLRQAIGDELDSFDH